MKQHQFHFVCLFVCLQWLLAIFRSDDWGNYHILLYLSTVLKQEALDQRNSQYHNSLNSLSLSLPTDLRNPEMLQNHGICHLYNLLHFLPTQLMFRACH